MKNEQLAKGDEDKTTPVTETVFDVQSSAPRAADHDSALAYNLDELLKDAQSMAKGEPLLQKRDMGLDDGGFPADMNDPSYLKGLPKKPKWDFDH